MMSIRLSPTAYRIVCGAAKLGDACDLIPDRPGDAQASLRQHGWCQVGWIHREAIERIYDVWWHQERREGRLWAGGRSEAGARLAGCREG